MINALQYRKEIDGLRALAIIPVVLYHAGFGFFSGGFVGVDIFFVISGYLITGIILRDMDGGHFSLLSFYERRFRRIFPALFVVCMVVFFVAYLFLNPTDMQDLSKSLLRVFSFISNIYFYDHSGYFDLAAELKPLIHTWSLSIEEQYYILFPLCLLLFFRFNLDKVLLPSVVLVFIVGTAYSDYLVSVNPFGGYYLIQSRLSELMLGSVLAVFVYKYPEKFIFNKWTFPNLMALIGIGLIIYSSVFFDKETIFPGFSALVPTIGAAMVIAFAQDGTFVASLLKRRFFVYVGLISYSLYLWHQPIFSLAKIFNINYLTNIWMSLLVLLSFFIAHLSWRFVETPFRNKDLIGNKNLKVFVLIGFIAAFALGNAGAINGFKSRFDDLFSSHPNLLGTKKSSSTACVEIEDLKMSYINICAFGDVNASKAIALWGDSHAQMLLDSLSDDLETHHVKGFRISFKDCGPIPGFQGERSVSAMRKKNEYCEKQYSEALNFISNNVIATVVSIRWTMYMYPVNNLIDSMLFDNKEGGVEPGKSNKQLVMTRNGEFVVDGNKKQQAIFNFVSMLTKNNRDVILLTPIPEVGWDIPRMNLQNLILGREVLSKDISTSYEVYQNRNRFINSTIGSIERIYKVTSEDVFCNNFIKGRCVAQYQGISYYADDDHLSYAGARLLTPKVTSHITNILSHSKN